MKIIHPHYVYKITNNNPTDSRKYYIGVRSVNNCSPEEDTNYWGSSKYLSAAINEIGLEHFSKEILSTWKTREEAVREEIHLHDMYEVGKNIEFYNKSKQTATGFDTAETSHEVTTETALKISQSNRGFTNRQDINTGKIIKVTLEEANNNKDLITLNRKMVVVFDKSLNKNRHVTIDEFKSNKNLIHINKGKVTALDLEDNIIKSISCEEYHKFKNIRYIMPTTKRTKTFGKGLVSVRNIITNECKKISKNEINPDIHAGINSKIIKIFNAENELVFTCYGNFDRFCIEKNLPCWTFKRSFKTAGKPIMTDLTKKDLTIFGRKDQLIYKGWYALVEKPNSSINDASTYD